MKRRERFSFEAFDALIDEALADTATHHFETPVVVEVTRMGADFVSLPRPAQPANVVDLNANVVDLFPPDEAA
jgi:hypothetical protein